MSVLDEAKNLSKSEIYNLRKNNFCKSQSISYENTDPLLIVRGEGAYLYDENDNKYLDTRNNVCHVGHQNETVVKGNVLIQNIRLFSDMLDTHPPLVLF